MTMDGSENDEELNKIIERKARELLKGLGMMLLSLVRMVSRALLGVGRLLLWTSGRRGVLHVSC
jgi:hypothetical protein